jgi:hypothetical protein
MAAGPMALSAVGAGEAPIMLPHLPAQVEHAKPARPTTETPAASIVSIAASEAEAAFVAASLDDLMGAEFDAPIAEGDADEPAARAAPARRETPAALAGRIRVALFRDSGCPSEQQSLVIIGAATRGWEAEAAGSALRIVRSDNDLCAAVSAALARSTVAAEAHMSQTAPMMAPAGGAPGGAGGPGYDGDNG